MRPELYEQYSKFMTKFGDLYYATKPPLCKAEQIEIMEEVINAGDILCRGYNYYLDSHFIPGAYTHSGIVLNKREMIHFIAEGADSIHPIDFIKDTDRFIVLRPPYQQNLHDAVNQAIWHYDYNKTEYDFTFKEDGKFYCHEGVADCLKESKIIINTTLKEFGIGPFKFKRNLYLAQNIIEKCEIIYEFNPK